MPHERIRKDLTMNDAAAKFYAQFTERFTQWAKNIDDIKAAYTIGSRARSDHLADEWSDMDILMFTSIPEYYLGQSDWQNNLGTVLSSFSTYTAGGDPERLTLFDGGYQVDFVVVHTELLNKLVESNTVHGNFHRGVRVLIDKNNISSHILPQSYQAPAAMPVSEEAFSNICHMFWFGVLYIAKQIFRDELWIAKSTYEKPRYPRFFFLNT